jgi:hypothetical protein
MDAGTRSVLELAALLLGHRFGPRVLAALLLAGCATANTPQQEKTYAAWAACQAEGRIPHTMQLQRVEADGRWWWQGYGQSAIKTCMAEQFGKMRRGTFTR